MTGDERLRSVVGRRGPVVEVVERTPATAVVRMVVEGTDPVFAGHYPGFPILPGVAVVEFAHRAALATFPGTATPRLAAIESTRFRGPVFPGAELTARLDWPDTDEPATRRCAAVVDGPDGVVARIVLRYEVAR